MISLQTIIQRGPIEKHDSEEKHQNHHGLVPTKISSLIKTMPDLLNQPYVTFSVYNVDKNSTKNNYSIKSTTLIDDIADLLGIYLILRLR